MTMPVITLSQQWDKATAVGRIAGLVANYARKPTVEYMTAIVHELNGLYNAGYTAAVEAQAEKERKSLAERERAFDLNEAAKERAHQAGVHDAMETS